MIQTHSYLALALSLALFSTTLNSQSQVPDLGENPDGPNIEVPNPPTDLRFENRDLETRILQWNSVGSGPRFIIEIDTTPAFLAPLRGDAFANGPMTEYELDKLFLGETNFLRLIPYNLAGQGRPSETISFYPGPPAPRLLTPSIEGKTIRLRWLPIDEAIAYSISVWISGGARVPRMVLEQYDDIEVGLSDAFDLPDLDSSKFYKYSVTTIDADGLRSSSEGKILYVPDSENTHPGVRLEGSLEFGKVPVGFTETRTIEIHREGPPPLGVEFRLDLPDGFSASPRGDFLTPGSNQSSLVEVTFSPTTARDYSGLLIVDGNHTFGNDTMPIIAEGIASTVKAIDIADSLDFGTIHVGTNNKRTLEISNRLGRPLSIQSYRTGSEQIELPQDQWKQLTKGLGTEESITLPVELKPFRNGAFSQSITIEFDGPGSPVVVDVYAEVRPAPSQPVLFNNVQIPMSLNTTGEPLTNNFIAELWSIQVPGNFETPIARAYFDKPGVFDGGIVHIPRDEKLGRWVVIKVWNKSLADSYDDSPVKGRSDRIFVWYGNQQTPVPLEIEAFKIGECDGSGRPWKRSTGATLGDRFVMAMIESCDPDHEWFLNDTPIPTPENNVLVIDRFKESDAGVYSIVEEVDGTEITHLTRVFLNRNGLGLFSAAFIDNTFQCYIYPSFGNAYILEKTNDSALNLWSPVQAAVGRYRNNDQYKFVTNDLQNPTGFYRVRRFQVSQGGLAMPFEGGTTAPNSVQGHEYRVRILDGRGIFGDDGVFQIQFDRTHNNYSITGITDIQSSTGTYAYQTSGSNQGTLELTDSNVGSTVSLNLTFNEAQAGVIILKSAITDDFQGQHSRGFVDSHPAEEEAPNNRAAVRHSLVYDFWRVLVKDVSFTGQAKNRAVADSRLFRPSSSDGQSNSIPTNL